MDFGINSARSKRVKREVGLNGKRKYEQFLQFYEVPPNENVTLEEFENMAVERLKVLKAVENIGLKLIKGREDYYEALKKELREKVKVNWAFDVWEKGDEKSFQEKCRRDNISHFILRLAYCKSDDLRRWFITQELDLFRFRFSRNSTHMTEFLAANNLNYEMLSDEEKQDIIKELSDSSFDMSPDKVRTTDYYKVDFNEALDLVKARRVYLHKGFACIPHTQQELLSIIMTEFRARLSKSLAVTAKCLPNMEEDRRVIPMLNSLSQSYLGQDYTNTKRGAGDKITADMIDGLAKDHFPLCMQSVHQGFKQNHHTRHWGRQQYGLFLKGIGLSLEEALRFWRTEFCKSMDVDNFDKKYAYGIRHNYGKEGKRANYTPYSCLKIITTNAPAMGDHHGCPFKHSDIDMLRQKLQAMRISKDGITDVLQSVKDGHYQIACTRYYELTHNIEKEQSNMSLSHPNQYFDESVKLAKEGQSSQNSSGSQNHTPSTVRSRPVLHNTPKSAQQPIKSQPIDDDFEDMDMAAFNETAIKEISAKN